MIPLSIRILETFFQSQNWSDIKKNPRKTRKAYKFISEILDGVDFFIINDNHEIVYEQGSCDFQNSTRHLIRQIKKINSGNSEEQFLFDNCRVLVRKIGSSIVINLDSAQITKLDNLSLEIGGIRNNIVDVMGKLIHFCDELGLDTLAEKLQNYSYHLQENDRISNIVNDDSITLSMSKFDEIVNSLGKYQEQIQEMYSTIDQVLDNLSLNYGDGQEYQEIDSALTAKFDELLNLYQDLSKKIKYGYDEIKAEIQ